MITQPSMTQLLRATRNRLADVVLAAVSDPKVVVEVEMMLSILDTLAVRSENEIAWMVEETEAAATVARALATGGSSTPELEAALSALDTADASRLQLSDVTRRYELAGEVLSCAAEASAASGDPAAQATVAQLVRERLANEQAVVGVFSAVGRTS